ncbi:MAG: hypothetical protein ACXVEE_09325 [Polyangiales bacterium]
MKLRRSRLSLAAAVLVVLAQNACSNSADHSDEIPIGDTGGSSSETSGDDTGGTSDGGGDDTGGTTTDGGGETTGDGGTACAPAICGTDTDCDGISDKDEGRFAAAGPTDTDKDGTPDYKDDDSDGDGIPDRLEWRKSGCDTPVADENDADGDGIPNFQDTDSDGNGLSDKDEVCPPAAVLTKLGMAACAAGTPYDFDGDGVPDYLDFDNDHDSSKTDKSIGLQDKTELKDNAGTYVGISLDTDGDGIPDLYDVDSDGDFILDLDDGTTDDDGDGKPAFRDLDTDGDGVGDACEARAKAAPSSADLTSPLKDTDGDGIPDYRDLDSDADFLADGKEDLNGNCIVDADETDRLNPDTDGDGTGDLAETALLGVAAAKDATSTPAKAGKFYFIVPYSIDGSKKPSPTSGTLALSTNLKKGDLAFIVDTTISMDEEIAALKTGLKDTIIPALSAKFTDLGIGVGAHDDFPTSTGETLGGTTSKPFYIPATGTISTDPTKSQAAANTLVTHSGGLIPESQVAAMYRAITGAALTWPEGSLPVDPAPAGTFGSMRFRDGSLPIVVPITDAAMHEGKRAKNTTPTGAASDYDSSFHDQYGFSTFNIDQLVAKLNEVGAKVIGVASGTVSRDSQVASPSSSYPYPDLAYLADKTGSYVPKTAFGGGITPNCKTGPAASTLDPKPTSVAADGIGGTCRLVYQIYSDGTGLSNAIVDGVGALLNSIAFDVYVRAYKDPADLGTVDPVDAFMTSIQPQPAGGTDPVTGSVCVTFSPSALKNKYSTPKAVLPAGDIDETIGGLNPGKLYCFAVNPKENTTVPPKTTPQTFKAFLTVVADKSGGGSISLGTDREVLFIVPPSLN